MRNPILVALDLAEGDTAMKLVEAVAPVVGGFKVGKELFVRTGPDLIRRLRAAGATVFLDLKFHDIPNTVARAVSAATELGVGMMTVHAAGGRAMIEAAEQAARETAKGLGCNPPLILGVTVLTSFGQSDLAEVGITTPLAQQVERLAILSMAAGLRGLVCSPMEVAFLRRLLAPSVQIVTPGIRAPGAPADDQKRTLSAAQALEAGADWLVVGRPIHAAPNPRRAAEEILASLPDRGR
jgi:orotidine-5'-phosphate decarboxylase